MGSGNTGFPLEIHPRSVEYIRVRKKQIPFSISYQ